MKSWKHDGQIIWELPPFREYLDVLDVGAAGGTRDQRFVVVAGEHGVGKTIGAQVFLDHGRALSKHRPGYIDVPPNSLVSAAGIFTLIAEQIGASTWYGQRPLDMAERIIARCSDEARLLIVDNAHRLCRGGNLDLLRYLADESQLVFAILGPPALETHLRRTDELGTRVMLRHRLRPPTRQEIEPIFEGFPPEVTAQIHADTNGNMRQVSALRDRLQQLSLENDLPLRKLTAKHVQAISSRFLMRKVA